MKLKYFSNAITSQMKVLPNEEWRDTQQAFISENWDNTSSRYTILEQSEIGKDEFCEIEVWIDSIIGTSSTGMKTGRDFKRIFFEDINHSVMQGKMYKFDNNYWINYFTDDYAGLPRDILIRRCNNELRMMDPVNGNLYTIPCVIEYDMMSPSVQISRAIITPNNHATVIVQGNNDTIRLFRTNTRFIIGGRPFKLYAYQNALYYDIIKEKPTILYLDLYLDEIHVQDDLENGIAYNGDYEYSITINSSNLSLSPSSKGKLECSVILNGEEVERPVIWYSDNYNIVSINQDGEYNVLGDIGERAIISCELEENREVAAFILIKVENENKSTPKIIIDPYINIIREHETIEFSINVSYNSNMYDKFTNIEVELVNNSQQYLELQHIENNKYALSALKRNSLPLTMHVKIENEEPSFIVSQDIPINVVSMLG